MSEAESIDLHKSLVWGQGAGALWTLLGSEDLNANLVRFPAGEGVGKHVNGEVDVLIVGVSGVGSVAVQGRCYGLWAGVVVLVPKGAMRSTRSDSAGFAYLTVHRHRGPLQVDRSRNPDL